MEQGGFIAVLFIIGLVVEAITGALAAGRYKMDLMGVIFIALITALGGGSLRDVLFNHHPITWIRHPEYILLIIISALLATRIPKIIDRIKSVFLILDAIGLAVFSVIGTAIVMELYDSVILAICGGVITGVFGGILRDILCNEIPLIFHKEIYASASIVASGLYFILVKNLGMSVHQSMLIAIVCATALRLAGIYFKLGLPVFKIDEDKRDF